ncbi:MAG: hypothetical protein KUG79_16185 [Pseudomonadales bacterium]|nr:hypothetical protein [Pseudomonadales bacterium]
MHDDNRTSLIVDPANVRLPPLTPAALARLKQNHLRLPPVRDLFSFGVDPATYRPAGPETLGLSERCLLGFNAGPPLTPSAYNNNLRIVQTPDHVVLITEMIHYARIVPIDGRPPLAEELRKWTGDSRGYWQGDTLVVIITNFTTKTATFQLPVVLDALDTSGAVGLGENLTLVERFRLISQSRLVYEYTIDEPATFTQPFTVVIPMPLSDSQMYEYACHEGNYAMSGILKGARKQEQQQHKAR